VDAYWVLLCACPEPPHPAEQLLPLAVCDWSFDWEVDASFEALDDAAFVLLCVAELEEPE